MKKLFLFLIVAVFSPLFSPAADRPNILFIFTDDQAPWALGKSGDPNVSTPNLDKLADEAMYLPNSFTVTPVCSPSRVSLLTSRYGSEMGITDWIKPAARDFKDNLEDQPRIDPAIPNFANVLKKAGYQTALIGKYHLGESPKSHPTKIGFDHYMGFIAGGTTPNNPKLEKDGIVKNFKGLTVDILTDEALDYLGKQKNAESPFLLCVQYRAPHARWLPVAPEDWAPFENMDPVLEHPNYPGLDVKRAKRMMREYLASVRGVDRNVGRLLAKLDEIGARDNTVVIFTSDHGYNMAHNGIWHKGNGHWILKKESMPSATKNIPAGQRPNLYDTSVKIPTLVRWPGKVKPGSRSEKSITNLDWFPTFAEIAEAEIPKSSHVRGRSIIPVLEGKAEGWDNEVFLQYSTKHQSHTHMRGWRSAKYKLVRDFLNPERDEFYDLESDPGETTNLIEIVTPIHRGIGIVAPMHREIMDEFDAKIRRRMKEIGDTAAG